MMKVVPPCATRTVTPGILEPEPGRVLKPVELKSSVAASVMPTLTAPALALFNPSIGNSKWPLATAIAMLARTKQDAPTSALLIAWWNGDATLRKRLLLTPVALASTA